MRAVTVTDFGSPDVLKLQDMPDPQPGPGELLIEVHASAMNPVDTKIRGGMRGDRERPFITGYDVSGVVRAMGDEVDRDTFSEGQQVYASPCLIRNGAHAEYVTVDARTAAAKPASLSHEQAAALPLVTLTAWESLHERAGIHDGENVLIHAGAGGVGHIAVQLAKLHRCRVLTTAGRDASIRLCRELGADVVINYREEALLRRVNAETDDWGCPVIFDTVGEPAFDASLDCVSVNGRMVTIVPNNNDRIVPTLFGKNATLHMEFMGVPTIYNINPGKQGEVLRTAAELADAGKLVPRIHKTVSLDDVADAHREQETHHVAGKIVVRVK